MVDILRYIRPQIEGNLLTKYWTAAATAVVGIYASNKAAEVQKDATSSASSAEKAARAEALAAFQGLTIPTVEELMYKIEPFELDELIRNPVKFDVSDLMRPGSAYENIKISPTVLEAQGKTLSDMSRVAEEGITASEQADLYAGESRARQHERGQREAILQQARERGVGGSGFELAAQLAAQQSGAGRQAAEGFNTQALAKQRALTALMNQGELAGRMRGQEYREGADQAQAKDAITAFNLQQLKEERLINQQRDMAAAQAKQNMTMLNEEDRRAMLAREAQLKQYGSAKEFELAKAKAGIHQDAAKTVGAPIRAAGAAESRQIAAIGSAITGGIGAYGKQTKSTQPKVGAEYTDYGDAYTPDDEDTGDLGW